METTHFRFCLLIAVTTGAVVAISTKQPLIGCAVAIGMEMVAIGLDGVGKHIANAIEKAKKESS